MSGGTEASLPTGEGKGNEGWKVSSYFLLSMAFVEPIADELQP